MMFKKDKFFKFFFMISHALNTLIFVSSQMTIVQLTSTPPVLLIKSFTLSDCDSLKNTVPIGL